MKTHTIAFVACLSTALLGCNDSIDSTDGQGKLFINLSTGETQPFVSGESVPSGYAPCSDEGCPAPYECDVIDANSCEVRDDCVASSSPGCNPDVEDCSAVGCAAGVLEACDPSECPAENPDIAMICDDSSVSTPECVRLPSGSCENILYCDPTVSSPSCAPSDCGPATDIAMICPDGSTAERVCSPDENEGCAWIHDCSTTVNCSPADCGPANLMGQLCDDGSIAEMYCMATIDGLCSWEAFCSLMPA